MEDFFPTKIEFLKLAKKGNLVPVFKEIMADLETPVSAFLKLGNEPYAYLLESVEGKEKSARYSFLGINPSLVFKSKGRRITLVTPDKREETFETRDNPLAELEKILNRYKQPAVKGLPPFSGGAVGYLGYDTVRFFENIPDKNKSSLDLPDSLFIFTDFLYSFDHWTKKIKVIVNVNLENFKSSEEAYEYSLVRIEEAVRRLRSAAVPAAAGSFKQKNCFPVESNFKKMNFLRAVRRAARYIKKGDIIQAVLSQVFSRRVESGAFQIYRALRSINPSPYLFYFNMGDFQLAGSSPEVHVRCEGDRVSLRPIAGTRPRGKNEQEDKRLEKALLKDPKEKAEHLMLVDLGRNDLGKVCEYKSVRVSEFMTVERYSHVMHLVSHVEGKLQPKKNIFHALRATFPAGTVTGAPKVRAMEIIDELENKKRGFYSGIVGYFSYSKNLDSCIAIRSIVVKDKIAYAQAGAGVVADSKPEKEYRETVNKAKALMKAIEFAEKGME